MPGFTGLTKGLDRLCNRTGLTLTPECIRDPKVQDLVLDSLVIFRFSVCPSFQIQSYFVGICGTVRALWIGKIKYHILIYCPCMQPADL